MGHVTFFLFFFFNIFCELLFLLVKGTWNDGMEAHVTAFFV